VKQMGDFNPYFARFAVFEYLYYIKYAQKSLRILRFFLISAQWQVGEWGLVKKCFLPLYTEYKMQSIIFEVIDIIQSNLGEKKFT